MQKKIFAWAMSMAVATMITCSGCAQSGTSTTDTANGTAQTTTLDETENTISGQSLSAIQSGTAGVTTDDDDLCDSYDSFDAEIALEDDNTKVTGNKKAVSVKNNRVTISKGGIYRISGKLTKGQIVVTGSEKVKLYLDGAEITSASGSALVCTNEKRTILTLAKGTENVLADSADNTDTTEDGNNIAACTLFTQDKLTINGSGSLTVTGNSADGIVCKDDLKLVGGAITVDAPEDGMNCDGAMEIRDGDVTVSSAEDGIQADGNLTISGGTVSVTTTGEVAASAQDDFQPGNFGGEMPSGDAPSGNPPEIPDGETFGGGNAPGGNPPGNNQNNASDSGANVSDASVIQAAAMETAAQTTTAADTEAKDNSQSTDTTAAAADDASSKGIKCGGDLVLSGGSCTITSTDHAVHAAGTAVLSGTALDITSDNKGISSHGDLTISDGTITIHSCTEGIESKAEMTISGGEIRILNATDDGLNTGGADSGTHAMTISGGYIYINASGNGVDSNGTWAMTGGTYSGTLNDDGYAEGGTVSGGTEVTANGGTGSMNGGAPAGQPGGGQGTPPKMPGQNNSDNSTDNS